MEKIVNIHIELLPEGMYLATSDDVQGLVVQGRTVSETLEIARDVIRRILGAKKEREGSISMHEVSTNFDYPLVLGM